ncbi:MAG: tail fiber domain-containing protein [Bacteroidota bacterium]
MRKLIATLFVLTYHLCSGQVPDAFKYQALARNASGQAMLNTNIALRISILDGSLVGPSLFEETHSVTTNGQGLFSLNVGQGTSTTGSFSGIDWTSGEKFLKVEADLSGGTNYEELGTSQLLSVPFALYARYAGTALLPNGTEEGNTSYWNGSEWVVNNNNLYNNGEFIGINTNSPFQRLDVNGQINIPLDSAYLIGNKSVLNTRGLNNVFIGLNSGANFTFAQNNLFAGYNSGFLNTIGSQNVFLGTEAGQSNLDGMMNTFVGRRAGFQNSSGNENTYVGSFAGQNTTTGQHNSFLGVTTGNSNTTGEENTFLGAHAGYFNTTGSNNTYVGNFAGQFTSTGNNNVYIGFNADGATSSLSNAVAIGAGSIATASNSIILGNSSITSIGGQVSWGTFSDRRLKTNIRIEKLGLEFIQKLRPVRYNYTAEGQHGIFYSGLIAQEVDDLLTELGTDFSGLVKPKNNLDHYSIRYGDFVIPLINAVQEQQKMIDELQKENEDLREAFLKMKTLEQRLNELEKK